MEDPNTRYSERLVSNLLKCGLSNSKTLVFVFTLEPQYAFIHIRPLNSRQEVCFNVSHLLNEWSILSRH